MELYQSHSSGGPFDFQACLILAILATSKFGVWEDCYCDNGTSGGFAT